MRLWLVRHAEPLGAQGLCYGRLDLAADDAATQQAAAALIEALASGAPGAAGAPAPSVLRCSPLRRTRQLAEALAPHLGLPVLQDTRLREMDFGRWEGVPWSGIPKDAIDAWTADFAGHAFGGGESTQQVLDRVWQALQEARGCGQAQVWVTHAGVIRAVQHLRRQGAPQIRSADQWPRQAPAFGSFIAIDF